jgi:spectinomycin phosphotransferase
LARLAAVVRAAYGVDGAIVPLDGGYDTAASVFRVGADYVLKVRDGQVYEPGVTQPTRLVEAGLAGVVAPVPTTDGRPWVEADGSALVLYPYVEGKIAGLNADQWQVFGTIVRRLHDSRPGDGLPVETYQPKWGGSWRTWDEARRVLVTTRQDEFIELIDTAESLADQVRVKNLPNVLCHADLHTYNVLVDEQGLLWLLDWDEVMLAPRERDLMFVLGGGISRDLVDTVAERNFMDGYGEFSPDTLALAYYRHAWAVQDIAGFGAAAATGDGDAARMLEGLFQPGQIVDLARRSR